MQDETPRDSEPVNPEVHHEQTDVDVRAILWFTVIFVVFAIVSHVLLWFHLQFLIRAERDPDLLPISLVKGEGAKLPPAPRLQPFPAPTATGASVSPLHSVPPHDMERMRSEQRRRMESWGWVDEGEGRVRMPVDRAMDLQLRRGFPLAPGAPTTTAGELSPAGPDERPPAASEPPRR
ncbi:MAG TPA: hypothetical protein VMS56_01395 [Thermoanaerobaculia bacterium]|nr:hypothetical protein [Thermoanaerobaculia bacterium]